MKDRSNCAIRVARWLILSGISLPIALFLLLDLYLFLTLAHGHRDRTISADEGMGIGLFNLWVVAIAAPIVALSTGVGTILMLKVIVRRADRSGLLNVILCLIGGISAVLGLILMTQTSIPLLSSFIKQG